MMIMITYRHDSKDSVRGCGKGVAGSTVFGREDFRGISESVGD